MLLKLNYRNDADTVFDNVVPMSTIAWSILLMEGCIDYFICKYGIIINDCYKSTGEKNNHIQGNKMDISF